MLSVVFTVGSTVDMVVVEDVEVDVVDPISIHSSSESVNIASTICTIPFVAPRSHMIARACCWPHEIITSENNYISDPARFVTHRFHLATLHREPNLNWETTGRFSSIVIKKTGALHRCVVVRHLDHEIHHLDYSPMYLDIFFHHVYPKLDKSHDATLSLNGSIKILTYRIRGSWVYLPYLCTIASLGHVICSIGSFKHVFDRQEPTLWRVTGTLQWPDRVTNFSKIFLLKKMILSLIFILDYRNIMAMKDTSIDFFVLLSFLQFLANEYCV